MTLTELEAAVCCPNETAAALAGCRCGGYAATQLRRIREQAEREAA